MKLLKQPFQFFKLAKPMCCLVLAAMIAGSCTQRESDNPKGSPDVSGPTAHAAHDTAARYAAGPVATGLPVVNRPHYHTVEIKQMKFHPQELTVAKGDTVVWVNNGITAHDVTAQPEAKWTSSSMPVGASWRMIADQSSDYYCSIHVVMKGKLVVK